MDLNQIRRTYRWMAPVYDSLFRRFYTTMRRDSIAALRLEPSDTVVLVGVGTGLDLALLPPVSRIMAADVTPSMHQRAAKVRSAASAGFVLADGAALPLRDASVSVVILHLVLSVAPIPEALLREAARVLRPGGRVAILDHFAPPGDLGVFRQLLARFPALLATHLDRRFEGMTAGLPFAVLSDRRLARGLYRLLILERTTPGPA